MRLKGLKWTRRKTFSYLPGGGGPVERFWGSPEETRQVIAFRQQQLNASWACFLFPATGDPGEHWESTCAAPTDSAADAVLKASAAFLN